MGQIWDTAMATIEKHGPSWRAIVRRRGYPPQRQTFKYKVQAEAWAREIEQAMDKLEFVLPSVKLVRDLFVRYKDEVSPKKRGAKWEIVRLKMLLGEGKDKAEARFMGREVSQVGWQDIRGWRDERLKKVSGASVNRELNLVSAVFSHAIKEWGEPMRGNPVAEVKRPARGVARRRRLSDGEVEKLKTYFKGEGIREGLGRTMDLMPTLIELAVETAMRMGELCSLEWSNVDLEGCWAYLPKTKNGEERYVPLSPRAVELISGLPELEVRVLPINTGTAGVYFREAVQALGLGDLHFHDTRREATTRLSRKLPVMELASMTGHKDLKNLMIYYAPSPSDIAKKL